MEDTQDYAALFLGDVPLMDTRAPVEFVRGAFPTAVNRPLMLDDERAQVGTRYKEQGQAAALSLGHELVSGETKNRRIQAWLDFATQHPNGYLYCFRGGLRSQICQQWMHEAGNHYPRVLGGYKAMRRFLINTLEEESVRRPLLILGGHTGAAKTALLASVPNSIDLEALAHHRGSAFGRRPGGQPSQISFENGIAIGLLKQARHHPFLPTVVEDESRLIGQRYLPQCLRDSMSCAPLVLLESNMEERVEHTFQNYILGALDEHRCHEGQRHDDDDHGGDETGFATFAESLRRALFNIRRRLGGELYARLDALLAEALLAHRAGDAQRHREWIGILLRDYYDPMYNYQLQQKRDRVVFAGKADAVLDYLNSRGEHA